MSTATEWPASVNTLVCDTCGETLHAPESMGPTSTRRVAEACGWKVELVARPQPFASRFSEAEDGVDTCLACMNGDDEHMRNVHGW